MRHTFLAVTVKRWLKSVYIYGSYPKIRNQLADYYFTIILDKNTDISTKLLK